jgi:tight adherence protein B
MTFSLPALAAVATGVAVLALVLGVYTLLRPAGSLEERLEETINQRAFRAPLAATGPGQRLRTDFLGRLNAIPLDQKLAGSLGLELTRAELGLTVNEYVAIRFGGALAGLLFGAVLMRNFLLGLLFAVLALQGPVILLNMRSRQRQRRFQAQLADIITMLASGLRAGIGLVQAMEVVRREMPPPASVEIGRVVREVGLGVSLGDALRALGERMPSDDLTMAVTAISIQAEVGGNLAVVLESIVTTIRERVRIMQEIRTLTSMQRATSYILAGLPFLVAGFVMTVNPAYMQPLFTMTWIWMPVSAVILVIVGFVIIGRIVDIKV